MADEGENGIEKMLVLGQEFEREISLDSDPKCGEEKPADSSGEFGEEKYLDSGQEIGKETFLDSAREFGGEKCLDSGQERETILDSGQEFGEEKTSDLAQECVKEKMSDSPQEFEVEKSRNSDRSQASASGAAVQPPSTSDSKSVPSRCSGAGRKDSSSPVRDAASANNVLDCRVRTQMGRVRMMEKAHVQLTRHSDLASGPLTLSEIDTQIEFIENHWNEFSRTHEKIEELCTPEFLEHPYMLDDVFDRASAAYQRAKESYVAVRNRLENLTANSSTVASINSSQDSQPEGPEFPAVFPDWKSFSDRFFTLVGSSTRISNLEKLARLRNAMRGESAALLAEYPIAKENYDVVWKNMIDYYESRRNLADSQLDRLLALAPLERSSARALSSLVATVNNVLRTSDALELADEHLQCRVIHIVCRLLDPKTRQAWDLRLGPRLDLPELSELLDFLGARARELQETKREKAHARSSRKSGSRHQSPTHYLSASPESSRREGAARSRADPESCSYCKSSHYIAFCPHFLSMVQADRRAIVRRIGLCNNCLGFHSTAECRNEKRCRKCGKKHHTLIHSASSSDPGTSRTERKWSTRLRLSSCDPYESHRRRAQEIRDRLG